MYFFILLKSVGSHLTIKFCQDTKESQTSEIAPECLHPSPNK